MTFLLLSVVIANIYHEYKQLSYRLQIVEMGVTFSSLVVLKFRRGVTCRKSRFLAMLHYSSSKTVVAKLDVFFTACICGCMVAIHSTPLPSMSMIAAFTLFVCCTECVGWLGIASAVQLKQQVQRLRLPEVVAFYVD